MRNGRDTREDGVDKVEWRMEDGEWNASEERGGGTRDDGTRDRTSERRDETLNETTTITTAGSERS